MTPEQKETTWRFIRQLNRLTFDELQEVADIAEYAVAVEYTLEQKEAAMVQVAVLIGEYNPKTCRHFKVEAETSSEACDKIADLIRGKDRGVRAMTPTSEHDCQICGARHHDAYLFDLKGNLPGGMKQTCLKCWGRLEAYEDAARIADLEKQAADKHVASCVESGCHDEASRYAARAAGAECIADCIRRAAGME